MKIVIVAGFNKRPELQFNSTYPGDHLELVEQYPDMIVPGMRPKKNTSLDGFIYPCVPSHGSEVKIGDRVEIISMGKILDFPVGPKKAKKLIQFFVRAVPQFKLDEEKALEEAEAKLSASKPRKKVDMSRLVERFSS